MCMCGDILLSCSTCIVMVVVLFTLPTQTESSAGLISIAAAEVYYNVPTKIGSKNEVSELPWVPICFHCCAHCVFLLSDACDFPPDNYEEQQSDSAHSLPGYIYSDKTWWVFRWSQEHIKVKFMCRFMDNFDQDWCNRNDCTGATRKLCFCATSVEKLHHHRP